MAPSWLAPEASGGPPSHITAFSCIGGHCWTLLGCNSSPTELGPGPYFWKTFEVLLRFSGSLIPGGRGVSAGLSGAPCPPDTPSLLIPQIKSQCPLTSSFSSSSSRLGHAHPSQAPQEKAGIFGSEKKESEFLTLLEIKVELTTWQQMEKPRRTNKRA